MSQDTFSYFTQEAIQKGKDKGPSPVLQQFSCDLYHVAMFY